MNRNVICDTNIMYHLVNNSHEILSLLDGRKLIFPGLTLDEVLIKAHSNEELVRSNLVNLLRVVSGLIKEGILEILPYYPTEHGQYNFDNFWDGDPRLLDEINVIKDIDWRDSNNMTAITHTPLTDDQISFSNERFSSLTENVIKWNKTYSELKGTFQSTNSDEEPVNYVLNIVSNSYPKSRENCREIITDIAINFFESYYVQLSTGAISIDKMGNDFNDLGMVLYCKPNSYYWTTDRKFLNKMGLTNYTQIEVGDLTIYQFEVGSIN